MLCASIVKLNKDVRQEGKRGRRRHTWRDEETENNKGRAGR